MNAPAHTLVDELIQEAVHLHTLPLVILETQRLMSDPDTNAQDIADLIAHDPALAERILRLANSAYYGFQRRIGNLTQAIVLLGFQTVKNLMLTVTVIETFRQKGGDRFAYARFWSHSVASAIASARVADLSTIPNTDQAYIGGLLHDVGKVIIAQHLPALNEKIEQRIEAGATSCEAEQELVGRDHADIGGDLAVAWGFPDSLAEAIRCHHAPPANSEQASGADGLHLADILVRALGLGHRTDPLPGVSPRLSTRLGYDAPRLEEWIGTISTALASAREFFELLGVTPERP